MNHLQGLPSFGCAQNQSAGALPSFASGNSVRAPIAGKALCSCLLSSLNSIQCNLTATCVLNPQFGWTYRPSGGNCCGNMYYYHDPVTGQISQYDPAAKGYLLATNSGPAYQQKMTQAAADDAHSFGNLLSKIVPVVLGGIATAGLGDLGALGSLGGAAAETTGSLLPGTVLANGATVLADGSIIGADGATIAGAGSAAVSGGTAAAAGAGAADAAASPLSNLNLMPSDQAIKNAALKTGLSLASGQDPTKALESGALGLVGGVVGSNVSNLVSPTISCLVCQNKGLTTGISNTIGSTVGNMVTGASPTNALISGIGSGVSSGLGQNGANLLSAPLAGAAGAATSAALKGADPTQILTNAAIGAGSNYVGSQISGALKDLAGNPTAGQTGGIGTMNSSSLNPDNGSADTTIPSGGLPSTTVASNDPLAGTGLTTDANGNLVFSNPSLTAAGPAGPMTAGLTNVPGSAPPSAGSIDSLPTRNGTPVIAITGTNNQSDSNGVSETPANNPESTVTNVDVTSQETPATTNDNTDISGGDSGGLSVSLPASSGSPGLSASDVQTIVAQQMAANPGLTEAQVKADIQSAMTANPGMTADQVNQIVSSNLAGVNNQVSGLQTGLSENKSALDALNNTVNTNQATTNSALASTNEAVANLSASDKAAFSQLTTDQQAQALKEAQDTGNLSSAISNVAAGTAENTSAIDALKSTVDTNQTQTTGALSNLTNTVNANAASENAAVNNLSDQEKTDFNTLSTAQQETAKALTETGTSLSDAINQVKNLDEQGLATLNGQLQGYQEQTQAGLSALGNTVASNQETTNQNIAATNQNVANLSEQEKTDFGQLSGQQQSDFQNLSSAQADLAKSLTNMGTSFGDAIDQVKNLDEQGIATVQGQLDAYQKQTQAGLDTTNQNIDDLSKQTQDEIAKSAEASAAANAATNSTIASNQASTIAALGGLSSGLTGLQQAQQQAKAQAMMPKFNNDTSELQSTDPHTKMAKMAALNQLYSSLDPDLKEALAAQNIKAPAEESAPEEQAAHGGLIHKSDGGTLLDQLNSIDNDNSSSLQKVLSDASRDFQPTPMKNTAPTGLESSTKYINSVKPRALQQLYNSINPELRSHLMGGGPVVGVGGMAEGGLPARYHPEAPEGHHPEFITGQTGYYAAGRGTGQSDDIPAMLHDGDYVIDADSVAQLGDGSSKAGAQALEHFRNQIPHHAHGGSASPVPAKIADGEYVLPAAFVTALGGGDNKTGSKLLDKMREELREHKRSAPVNKIPPKAKSPLDYLRMAKG